MKKFLLVLFLIIGTFVFAEEKGMDDPSEKKIMDSFEQEAMDTFSQEGMQKKSLKEGKKSKSGFVNLFLGPTFKRSLEVDRINALTVSVGKINLYGKNKCSASLGLSGNFLIINHECHPLKKGAWSAGVDLGLLFGVDTYIEQETSTGDSESPPPFAWKLAGGGKVGLNTRYRISRSVDMGIYAGVVSTALFDNISEIGSSDNILGYIDASFRLYF